MKYKMNEAGDGIIVDADGRPTVIGDDGKEFGIDAISANATMATLRNESKDYRVKAAEYKTKLDTFVGIDDPIAALDALQKVGSLDEKMNVKMDALKDTINKTWEDKQTEWQSTEKGLTDKLFKATVGARFATSDLIKKTVLPADIAEATFGHHFSADGTAKDTAGNVLYSKAKPGEPAEFEEAIGMIIDAYPAKDSILKSSIAPGGGGHQPNPGGSGDQQTSAHDNLKAGLKARGIT